MTKILFLIILINVGSAFAHGQDKLGPNGGFIQMPGAFHTEVVPAKDHFKVFLLDLEFKDPMVADSSVEYTLKQKTETTDVCQAKENSFVCPLPKGLALKSGELLIKAKRNNAIGGIVSYKLPLTLQKHN